MKKVAQKLLLPLPAALLLYIALGAPPALALGGNEYTIASQPDKSYFCPDFEACFTGGSGQANILLGKGSTLGDSTIGSLTIAKDENSPYAQFPWTISIQCYTESTYTTTCPDWVQFNSWNGFRSFFIIESATSSPDNKYWTADFTNPAHARNTDDTFPIKFRPEYYYKLVIDDNGYNTGAYGSQSLGVPYYVLRGIKTKPDPVIIIPGILGSWQKNGQWVLDPILHTYDNMIDTFAANGYVEGQTLFRLPYDWEQSNVVTAQLLKQKIDEIKTICSCQKIDIIAHSMGGLATTYYIESTSYQDDIDQVFFMGTPFAGSAKAYKAWEAGDVEFGNLQANLFLGRAFAREATDNGYSSVFNYIHGKPVTSIQELLPVRQNYLQTAASVLHYPTGYPQNIFLENLLTDYLNKVAPRVQTYLLTGEIGTTSTVSGYTIKPSTQLPKWVDGEPTATFFSHGDGTVPAESSGYFLQPSRVFNGVSHTDLPSASYSYIFKQMTGNDPAVLINKVYSLFLDADWSLIRQRLSPSPTEFQIITDIIRDAVTQNSIVQSVLFITLFSPLDMQITAPDGKHLGKDFAGGGVLNEIPNARYSAEAGEHEYAIILNPQPGQYKIDTLGTGSGAYTIAAGYATAATSSIAQASGTTSLNQAIANTLFISTTSTTIVINPPPVATSTPTTTPITPETCIADITAAYKNKWIGKKVVFDKLVFDCKALKELYKAGTGKPKGQILLINTAIKLVLADMDLLAKDKANTKDAVLLIGKITSWFKNHPLQ